MSYKIEKNEIPKERQNDKIENIAGSVWLSLFMYGNDKLKLLSTHPSTGLRRLQHLNMVI
jgi:hypothetical protein